MKLIQTVVMALAVLAFVNTGVASHHVKGSKGERISPTAENATCKPCGKKYKNCCSACKRGGKCECPSTKKSKSKKKNYCKPCGSQCSTSVESSNVYSGSSLDMFRHYSS